MSRNRLFAIIVIISIFGVGCAGKRIKINPDDSVQKYKSEFMLKYGFFVTDKEAVSYYQDALGVVGKEKEIFKNLKTTEDVDKFIEVFMKVRDPDPNTPENEFKIEKDNLIDDIQNEALATSGVNFKANGGLRGDLARVYLLRGLPNCSDCIQKLPGKVGSHGDLMVWYYIDSLGRHLFRFLFYEKYGRTVLFKNYRIMVRPEDLFSPLDSPLKEISDMPVPSAQDLYDLLVELEREDPQGIFLGALLEFSSYSDVVIERGDIKKGRFGALDPPEPAALIGARSRPTILGQPSDFSSREFIKSSYHSFIPAILRLGINKDAGAYISYFLFKHGNLDWEIKSDKEAECLLMLRISFQHKDTREIKEFFTIMRLAPNKDYLEKNKMTVKEFIEKNKDNYFGVPFGNLPNAIDLFPGTLTELLKKLELGTYIVNVDLRHEVTKKSAGGWREEIVVR